MSKPAVEVLNDHLKISFHGVDVAIGLVRSIVVPFSTIASADVAPPTWPKLTEAFGAGLRAPPLVLKGSIGKMLGPWDRFYWQDRRTDRVLRLRLVGHPRYQEINLDVEDPDALLERIEVQRGKKGA